VKIVILTSVTWIICDFILFVKFISPKNYRVLPPEKVYDDLEIIESTFKNDESSIQFWRGENIDSYGPGENGKPVNPIHFGYSKDEVKEQYKIHQFNVIASDLISLDRSLPDVRNEYCKAKHFFTDDLPTTSVIIVFYNEAFSTLLRTIHSIINRTPWSLLEEIILIDDASTFEHLKTKLETAIKSYPVKIKIFRHTDRRGLIQARILGAKNANGDTLTFLDAHCECTKNWLPPLLTSIKKNRKTVTSPIIDVISDENFEYLTGSERTYGGFNWKLNFRWYPIPESEYSRRNYDQTEPVKSPAMAGGLFAIDRDYFFEIGTYDEEMQVWGGENLEMSFRIWQCGGKLEIHPCSHVGHVFRKQTPYSFPGGTSNIINHNNRRVAEVWMDEYKKFFYLRHPKALSVDPGNVQQRKSLRKDLNCKSFSWYLENIYLTSSIPKKYLNLGEIRNKKFCLDTLGKISSELGVYTCHGEGGNQLFSFTESGRIQIDDQCVESDRGKLRLGKCHDMEARKLPPNAIERNQKFKFVDNRIIEGVNSCFEIVKNKLYQIELRDCDLENENQLFILTNITIPGM